MDFQVDDDCISRDTKLLYMWCLDYLMVEWRSEVPLASADGRGRQAHFDPIFIFDHLDNRDVFSIKKLTIALQ